jgi:ankyrin repeat protein
MERSRVKAVLQAAAGEGARKVLQQVISEGKVGVVDDDSNTPLMYAAASGQVEAIRMLVDSEVGGRGGLCGVMGIRVGGRGSGVGGGIEWGEWEWEGQWGR